MKRLSLNALLALAIAACSTTTPTDGGTSTGGGTTGATTGSATTGGSATAGSSTGCGGGDIVVTVNSVDLFPPAVTWLHNNNLPVPSIFDAGFSLVIDGVHLDISHATAVLTTLGTLDLNDSTPPPPYVFHIDAGLTAIYDLGLLVAVGPTVPSDGGTVEPQLTCGQLAQAIDAGTGSLGGGYFDYFIPAGNQPPPALANAVAGCYSGTVYGLPASYIAQLSCAAGISTDDGGILATGIGLVYFTQAPYGAGTPVAGAAVLNVTHGAPNGQVYYYSNDFSAGSQTAPTDATGVAAITAVVNPLLPPTFNVTTPTGGPAWAPISVQTNPGAVLEVIPIVPSN